MKRIGLTGGVGSGKSYVADLLACHFNAYVIKADNVSHTLMKKGTKSYSLIVAYFGRDILDADEEIDRKKLGEIVFSDRSKLEQLNQFVHPYVYEKIQRDAMNIEKINRYPLLVIEVPLLIEAGFKELVDDIWFVYAHLETRIERLKRTRNYSEERIQQIMNNQLSDATYRQHANYEINNSYSTKETLEQIKRILKDNGGPYES